LFFAVWQLVMPPAFASVWGLNPVGVAAWRTGFGLGPALRPVPLAVYTMLFRASTLVMWAGYGGLLWFVGRGAALTTRWTWPLAVPLLLFLALAMPPSLSTDVFAYVGYARLAVVHGLNPHLYAQTELIRLGDPTAPYVHWPISSPYGPLWTLISMAVVFVAPAGAVLGPVVALKAGAGAAVLATAAAARAIAGRADGRRADAVFTTVALNPLLLIEGPGNGHNDLVMVALLLTGFAVFARGSSHRGAVLVGLAAAVKLVPLVVVPWLVVLAVRAAPPGWRARAGAAALTCALSVGPVVVAYAPFWAGSRTLEGVAERWRLGVSADGTVPDTARRNPDSESANREAGPPRHSIGAAIKVGLVSCLRVASRVWPALLIYLWALSVMGLGRGDAGFRLATVWSFVALGGILFGAGRWFPWYLAWVWPAVCVRFTRSHMALAAFAWPLSLWLMLAYAIAPH
jgi:hypothetical protein